MNVSKKFGPLLLVMVAGGMGSVSAQTTPAQTPIVTMPVPPADVKIETVSLAPGIYMLIGRGGNVGLTVGVDGAAIIDDQFEFRRCSVSDFSHARKCRLSNMPGLQGNL